MAVGDAVRVLDARSSRILAAVEDVWRAIQARHPDVPSVIVTLGAGTETTALRLGHFCPGAWAAGTLTLGEVFLAGEGLRAPAEDVLDTLLHEAAHGMCDVRNIHDTSRGGRYHNRRFRAAAIELGLECTQAGTAGWSDTRLRPATVALWGPQLAQLREAITAWRQTETAPNRLGAGRPSNNNGAVLTCGCGRRIRVAPSIADLGPIWCGLCRQAFQPRA